MNEHAAKVADDELYKRHPELTDASGKRRPLTMNKADTKYRKEWMMYYKAVDKADKKRFGECEVGGAVQPCPPVEKEKWDQLEVLKILCNSDDKWAVDVLKHQDATTLRSERIIIVDKKYKRLDADGNPIGAPSEVSVFETGGLNNADERMIHIVADTAEEAATTIVHEARHQVQDKTKLKTWVEQEIDAYAAEEEFRIRKGYGSHDPSFRRVGADGKTTVDREAIRKYVTTSYPVEPGWVPGDPIEEGTEDISNGWDCARLDPPKSK